MKPSHVALLAPPGGGTALTVDATRGDEHEFVEALLVDASRSQVFGLAAGIALLPPDPASYLRAHANVLRRMPLRDPRIVRLLIPREGVGHDRVSFDEVIRQYGDLLPSDARDPGRHAPLLTSLGDALLAARPTSGGTPSGVGLVVGAGVGRACFELRRHVASVLGLSWSLACVRRGRNIATTPEAFHLPVRDPDSGKKREVAIDLAALVRDGVDWVAGDAHALPFTDDSMDVVVVGPGDERGPWRDPRCVLREARRVLIPGGTLLAARDEEWVMDSVGT